MTRAWEEPIQARGDLEKKWAFFSRRGEGVLGKHGGAEGAWSSSIWFQGQALAGPKSLA